MRRFEMRQNSKNTFVLSGLWSDGTGGIKGAKMGINGTKNKSKFIQIMY